MQNSNYPILSFLKSYTEKNTVRFHMPGHKGLFNSDINKFLAYDITEINGADNLLIPQSIIKQSQDQCAKSFGADHTFFLTQGSTVGILTMFLCLPKHSTVLIARNCHKSVISALALSGHNHIFVFPEKNPFSYITPTVILNECKKNPKINAVFITRPDYFGNCCDIDSISLTCEHNELLLLVDEAHGAHFSFSDMLPKSSVPLADMVVQSAHKTLFALTQAAYLHVNLRKSTMPSYKEIQKALALVHTSSPSYLILASLEHAWQEATNISWSKHIIRVEEFIKHSPKSFLFEKQSKHEKDLSRIVIQTHKIGFSGFEAQSILERENVFVEMADERCLVCITSPHDPDLWYNKLALAIKNLQEQKPKPTNFVIKTIRPTRLLSIREATFAKTNSIKSFEDKRSLSAIIGRTCASTIGAYPPGIAVILPGEQITQEIVEYLAFLQSNGATLFGLPFNYIV